MSGRFRSLVALLCCLVVVGCSGASEAPVAEPPAETPTVEVTPEAEAEPQPEDPTAAAPGEQVDPAALLVLVETAQEGVKTVTFDEKENYTLKDLKISVQKRHAIDARDPDHPVGMLETLKGAGAGNVMVHDGDKTYSDHGDGWELMQEGSVLGAGNGMYRTVVDTALHNASEAVYIGEEKVGDFATRHYELKADELEYNEQWSPAKGDKFVFGLWLNQDNVPVKLKFDHVTEGIDTDKITKEYVVTSLDPVKISVPDPAKVKQRS